MTQLYIKDGIIKKRSQIVITIGDKSVYNPKEELLLEHGWELYVIPEPTEEELLQMAKMKKCRELTKYDSSDQINLFYIGDQAIWLDKNTRAGLKLRFEAESALEKTDTTLWYNGVKFPLKINDAILMLYILEEYASKCYDNTQFHLSQIAELETVDAVEAYDYTVGYPEKLKF